MRYAICNNRRREKKPATLISSSNDRMQKNCSDFRQFIANGKDSMPRLASHRLPAIRQLTEYQRWHNSMIRLAAHDGNIQTEELEWSRL